MSNSQSTITLQNVYDDLVARGDLDPGWDMAGYTVLADHHDRQHCVQAILRGRRTVPLEMESVQSAAVLFQLLAAGLRTLPREQPRERHKSRMAARGDGDRHQQSLDVKTPAYIEVGRNTPRNTGAFISNSAFQRTLCTATFLPNSQMYFGTWGATQAGNATWGNNPQSGQVVHNPLVSGAPMPNNPILQIKDANGNFLVLTGYGTLGTTAPVAPAASLAGVVATPGSGDTTAWTVVDPQGAGIRITPVPSQTGTVWQVNLIGQAKPVQFSAATSLSNQTLYPLTDDFYTDFLEGCRAQCYGYSPNAKTREKKATAEAEWLRVIQMMKKGQDREKEENSITVKRSIMGAGGGPAGQNFGPFWPFGGRPN